MTKVLRDWLWRTGFGRSRSGSGTEEMLLTKLAEALFGLFDAIGDEAQMGSGRVFIAEEFLFGV